ncbi:MAG: LPXTG cell wall anchor domain-containing protein [Loigolactobacillus coryniformis]|uniref:LPXTG cell wall anchor domain-containing protein n=1 Tax=Loigolactobacillus coryniformis TaxID=1610 RepID=UPI0026499B1E|nr:LPXTG cell wall anchor domain-containing protein [Loigolactobacillus coryniformis]MDN5953953.1 LPXTG cell wall anchor domain-containing protein [Loigolactobacillus coryniformis]
MLYLKHGLQGWLLSGSILLGLGLWGTQTNAAITSAVVPTAPDCAEVVSEPQQSLMADSVAPVTNAVAPATDTAVPEAKAATGALDNATLPVTPATTTRMVNESTLVPQPEESAASSAASSAAPAAMQSAADTKNETATSTTASPESKSSSVAQSTASTATTTEETAKSSAPVAAQSAANSDTKKTVADKKIGQADLFADLESAELAPEKPATITAAQENKKDTPFKIVQDVTAKQSSKAKVAVRTPTESTITAQVTSMIEVAHKAKQKQPTSILAALLPATGEHVNFLLSLVGIGLISSAIVLLKRNWAH